MTKKFIALMTWVSVALVTSVASVQAYNDVADEWFAPFVTALAGVWVFDWTKESFRPGDNMNRAEFVKTLIQTANITKGDAPSAWFSDVSESDWFDADVNSAVELGFVDWPKAEKWNKFFPANPVSRAEAVKIALWALKVNADDYQEPAAPFKDISWHWAEKYITAAYNLSIVDWVWGSNDVFDPSANISRAAVAKIAAYSAIVADDPATYVRFEDWTSAFSTFTAENIADQLQNLISSSDTDDTDTDTDTESGSVAMSNWSLEISLSADSPKWAVVPHSVAWVTLAKFDVTANWDDVKLQSLTLTRKGIWDSDDLIKVTIYDESWRVSNSKWFNSDDEASVTFFSWWINIKAWETRTFSVIGQVATIWSNGIAAWNRDAVSLLAATAVLSNATEVVWDFPIVWSTFEIWSVTWATVDYETWATVANVKLWEEQVVIERFKLSNTTTNEDADFNWITLKQVWNVSDTDLTNYTLYKGTTKLADWRVNWKYVSFTLAEPFTVKQSKIESFDVKADIVGWANNTIQFNLDQSLDLKMTWKKYWFWAFVSTVYAWTSISIGAWKITLIKVDADSDKIRPDKKWVVLWKIKVVANAWKDLEWEKAYVTISVSTWTVGAMLQNIKLYDEKSWATFELTASSTASSSVTYSDTELWISLTDWETRVFDIKVDSKKVADWFVDWTTFNVAINDISTAGTTCSTWICIKETWDDKYVSDIVPSAIAFASIEWTISSATTTVLSLSAAKNVVIWWADVPALDFEVKADKTSSVKITDFIVSEAGSNTWFTSSAVTEVKLWKKEWTNETLISTVWGSQISSSYSLSFTNLDVTVPKDEKSRFVVTVSVTDNSWSVGKKINLKASSFTANDDDDKLLTVDTVTSPRTLTLVAKWSIDSFAVDNTDSEINNKDINVLAWVDTKDSPFIWAIELRSSNESVKIVDMYIYTYSWSNAGSWAIDLHDSIESISLYDTDKTTLLATETVSTGATLFDNLNYTIDTTAKDIYIKAKFKKIWDSDTTWTELTWSWITFWASITDAKWSDSWDKILWWNGTSQISTSNAISTSSTTTKTFVVATQITNVDLVDSYQWVTKATNLNAWDNVIWILELTAASTTNLTTSWSNLKVVMTWLTLDITQSVWTWYYTFNSIKIERIWWNWSYATWTITNTWSTSVTFAGSSLDDLTSDTELINWKAYFKITANIDSSTIFTWTNDPKWYIKTDINNLNWSWVSYASCKNYTCSEKARWGTTITSMNFRNKTKVDSAQIQQK